MAASAGWLSSQLGAVICCEHAVQQLGQQVPAVHAFCHATPCRHLPSRPLRCFLPPRVLRALPALQLIYNFPEQLFADAGVMAIEHADFDGIERLALVTGGC